MHLVPPSLPCLRQLVAGDLVGATRESGLSFEGRPWPDDLEMREGLAVHLSGCELNPRDRLWRVYMIASEDDIAVGHAGFKGGPSRQGEVEIYWCVEPPFRALGIATAAALSLANHAFDHASVRAIVATIASHNVASQRVAAAAGLSAVTDGLKHGLPLWRLARDAWQPGTSPMAVRAPVDDA